MPVTPYIDKNTSKSQLRSVLRKFSEKEKYALGQGSIERFVLEAHKPRILDKLAANGKYHTPIGENSYCINWKQLINDNASISNQAQPAADEGIGVEINTDELYQLEKITNKPQLTKVEEITLHTEFQKRQNELSANGHNDHTLSDFAYHFTKDDEGRITEINILHNQKTFSYTGKELLKKLNEQSDASDKDSKQKDIILNHHFNANPTSNSTTNNRYSVDGKNYYIASVQEKNGNMLTTAYNKSPFGTSHTIQIKEADNRVAFTLEATKDGVIKTPKMSPNSEGKYDDVPEALIHAILLKAKANNGKVKLRGYNDAAIAAIHKRLTESGHKNIQLSTDTRAGQFLTWLAKPKEPTYLNLNLRQQSESPSPAPHQ
ncbi:MULTISPECIES: hypothetical protein [Cysteiniphilum]|uniref:hypothetical protein n=1 Tax=Cysteiniphilum TaxID=2056696 RepID=UPI00177DC13F|nr:MULTISPECIES: hypothetical protein [Cysteiniphilum]